MTGGEQKRAKQEERANPTPPTPVTPSLLSPCIELNKA